ncbi:twin-arginine translocation signal domain-containing protein [Streptomyces sp. NPDC006129]|uniref:twin-arginine translocation signal domain-containing protein n=1 Tax=unclassified Streptomyces TaxID=2593676 RepID=UPI0033A1FDC2
MPHPPGGRHKERTDHVPATPTPVAGRISRRTLLKATTATAGALATAVATQAALVAYTNALKADDG